MKKIFKKSFYLISIFLSLIVFITIIIYSYITWDFKHVYIHHFGKGESFTLVGYDFYMHKHEWVLKPNGTVDFKFKNPKLEGYNEAHIGWHLKNPLLATMRDDSFDENSHGIIFKGESTDFCNLDVYLNENREIVKKEYRKNRFLWWCY
jgi:hypothetical protein